MENLRSTYLGGFRTEVTHLQSNSTLLTDAPTDNNGKGEAFSPSDLLAAALGCCAITIMGMSAKTHNFSIDGTTVKTTKKMGTEPRRVVEIVLEFTFPENNYSDKQKKILELAVKECPVAQSLHPDLKQTLIFNF